MNFETFQNDLPMSPVNPKAVVDVSNATRSESYSTTLSLITGAIGFTGVSTVPGPILSLAGDKVGSHWRNNPVWGVRTPVKTLSVTETALSAAFTVYDPTNNLEQLFEGVGTGRFLARLTTNGGQEIYGYIGGVSVSNNVYTFTVFNGPALGTQSWIGTIPGSGAAIRELTIFRNESSLAFTTGTVLTREVPWAFAVTEEQSVMDLLASLSNGDYAVDYARGKIYYKKATPATSDTVTYLTYGGSGGPTPDVNLAQVNGNTVGAGAGAITNGTLRVTIANDDPLAQTIYTDDTPFVPASGKGMVMFAEADETSPDPVDEGDAGALRMTLTRFLKVSLGDLLSGEDQTNNVMQTVDKPLSVSTYTPDLDTSTAAEASSVTKASSGVLYGVTFSNANASPRFLQFFNSTTVPADTTVPVIVIQCPALSTIVVEWPKGRYFSTGIAWCNSSTQNTKTIGSSDSLADVNYK